MVLLETRPQIEGIATSDRSIIVFLLFGIGNQTSDRRDCDTSFLAH